MGILTANLDFLASLGITTSEQFNAAFGGLAEFTAYCESIGYSWELDENNDIVLITPHGNKVPTSVSVAEKTDTPTITVTPGDTEYAIAAIGNGTVKLYIDDTEVPNPAAIARTNEPQEITITATAQEDGKEISDEAEEEITIPALETTAAPDIESIPGLDSYDIVAIGDGTVKLYLEGNEVSNPYTVIRTDQSQTLTFTATAQEAHKQISEVTEEEFVIPALPITATPTISYDSTTFTVNVSGNGTVLSYVDGVATPMPHTFTRGASAVTYVVTATAQEEHKQISAVATMNCAVPAAVTKNYMKLSVLNQPGNDGDITITIPAAVTSSQATSMSYSKDGANWVDTAVDYTDQTIVIPVVAGDEVYLKGVAATWAGGTSSSPANPSVISSSVDFNVSGNIMSMLYGDNFENEITLNGSNNFYRLFYQNSHLINANQLELPATSITQNGYRSMFEDCTSLTSAPALPATSLQTYCYNSMFKGCTSLTSAPALNATTTARMCCYSMFSGCTSLTSAPALPATKLTGNQCYSNMFNGCTSLTSAPALPATTITQSCYQDMFHGCTSLTSAPALPATTLIKYCYQSMFSGCTSLSSITMLAEDISASGCLSGWVQNVASTGTFTKSANMTTLPTGSNGIPDGWTVVDAA